MNNLRIPRSFKIIPFLIIFSLIESYDQPFEKKWNLDIVYIGNSITQGAQLGNPDEEAPPAAASEYLRHQSGVENVQFVNQGRSGYTTVDYLPSDSGALSEVIASAHQLHKDTNWLLLFTISLGTNDSAEKGPNGSPVDPADYQKNLKSIADKLLSEFPQCKIVLLQPIWYSPNTYNSAKYLSEGLARLQNYFPELQDLVAKYSQTNPGHVFLGDLKGFAYFRNNYLTDLIPESGNAGTFYLHPNKKGANVLGRLWGEAIYESLFKQAV
jgi:lysophospholipase L1-like esterase